MSRPARSVPRPAVIAILAGSLLGASCARHPKPQILPGEDVPGLSLYLDRQAASCRGIERYAARGVLTVRSGGFKLEGSEEISFRAPDRLRMRVDFPGFLWMGPTSGEVLVRGESLYVFLPRLISPWNGTRAEFLADWSWRGLLVLAATADATPRGPFDCVTSRGDLVVREAGDDAVTLERTANGLFWQLLVDLASGRPREGRVSEEGSRATAVVSYREFRPIGEFLLPARMDVHYRAEDLLITVQHEEQRVNPPLADSLFDPGAVGL